MLSSFFENIENKNIVIIGDVMIDAYLKGEVKRISPEAPVPILDVKKRDYRLGGAANVALNIKSLGANPILFSVIGNDFYGDYFKKLLTENEIPNLTITASKHRKTTIKYRLIGNGAQMMRIDDEDIFPLQKEEYTSLLQDFKTYIANNNINAIIFEDYDKGTITPELILEITSWANERQIPVLVDPKKENFHHYNYVTFFKPNLKEWCDALHLNAENIMIEQLKETAETFAKEHHIHYIMITLSSKGLAIWDNQNQDFFYMPTLSKEVVDVSGAGDSVISIVTMAIINKLNHKQIAKLSNLAGGAVCQYSGVVPITPTLLQKEFENRNYSY